MSERIPAYALYIDPPLGRVGMTEAEARASGRPLLVGSRPMTRVSRAVEKGETQGLMKVVADADTRQILGAAILGVGGDEAIHGVIDMMNARATIDAYMRAVPIHPTVSELIPTVLGEMKPVGDLRLAGDDAARRPVTRVVHVAPGVLGGLVGRLAPLARDDVGGVPPRPVVLRGRRFVLAVVLLCLSQQLRERRDVRCRTPVREAAS